MGGIEFNPDSNRNVEGYKNTFSGNGTKIEMSQTGYLYHRVPADLKGHTLYPLNQLKTVYPSLYVAKAASYQDREAVMQARLPILGCLCIVYQIPLLSFPRQSGRG